MDEKPATPVDEPRQWVHLESAVPLVAEDRAPRRGVGIRVLALAAVVALGCGIGIGALATDGDGSGDEAAIEETTPIDPPADAERVRHMVPRWLPDGLQLQSVDDGYRPGSSCQPSTIGGAAPAAAVSGAIQVGPGVCATPTSSLRYLSAPLQGTNMLTFIQAGAADIRSSATTTTVTVRGKSGLLYRSGETLWLAWTEDAETTFFITATGLSEQDVLRVAESVAVIDAEEWSRLRATSPQSATVSNGPPSRTQVVACLRAEGLEIPELPTGPASVVPSRQYPAEVAQRAWQACRDAYARSSGMPTNQLSQILAVPDCMAAQGWLIVVMSGPPADGAAYSAAMQKCQPIGSMGPPGRVELAACLRAQGLDGPDLSTGPTSVTSWRQYPSDVAQAAWQACRDAFIKASGTPPSSLSLYDCMAGQGWILALVNGPPADTSAFNAAMQKCQPVGSSTGPPGRVELAACLRAQGLEVPEVPTPTSVTSSRQYPADVAQAAWQACRDAYIKASGIPPSPLSMYDCMAGQGWLLAISSGPPADSAAFNAAMQKCQPVGSSTGSPGRVELVGCLRTRGLEVPDLPTGPTSITSSRQYPADVALAAWQACRDAYIKSSGIPPSALAMYDCMAGHGWILATFTGPPADTVAYGSASQSCSQRI